MGNAVEESAGLRRIDIERFFQVLSGRLEEKDMEMVAAALAESAIEKRGENRVLRCSSVDPSRLLKARCLLREKLSGARQV